MGVGPAVGGGLIAADLARDEEERPAVEVEVAMSVEVLGARGGFERELELELELEEALVLLLFPVRVTT